MFTFLLLFGAPGASEAGSSPARDAYAWRNVSMGGGGYVTGIVAHPREANLLYIRTDVGGAYRFSGTPDALGRNWVPLTDSFDAKQWNYYGIESIAIDPSDPNVVYIAAGKYSWAGKGRLFRSSDRGASWKPLPLELPMDANGQERQAGERLAVDPFDGRRVYFGSRTDGLWVSEDAGASWKPSGALPAEPDDKTGITFVLADPAERPPAGRPARLYIGLYGAGVAQSDDGGATWALLGGPQKVLRAVTGKGGVLIAAGRNGVHRFQHGSWTDITPKAGLSYCAIALDPKRPQTLIVSEIAPQHQLPLYISQNGGQSWTALTTASGNVVAKADVGWWPGYVFSSATSALLFDPIVKDRLWLTDWYGTWFTKDYRAPVPHFTTLERGHEEMVVMTLMSPPEGAWLFSGTVDTNGFRHTDTDWFPDRPFNGGGLWQTFGLDFQEAHPNNLVRVGTIGGHDAKITGGVTVSRDNGKSWTAVSWPYGGAMKAAYSASDPNSFVVLPLNDTPKVTKDGGASWQDSQGVAGNAITTYWHWQHPLAADRVKGKMFYLYSEGIFYRSEDGGLNWQKASDLPRSQTVFVEAVSGHAGWVFIALGKAGLYFSHDGGQSFDKLGTVKTADLFSLGRPKPFSDKPTLYIYGQADGTAPNEILRSDNMGQSWQIISTPGQPVGDQPSVMRADMQTYGRVFIGTNGRGIYVGDQR